MKYNKNPADSGVFVVTDVIVFEGFCEDNFVFFVICL